MRFISGFILGVLITIGAAYVHDSMTANSMSGPDPTGDRMVNWEVVSHSFNRLASALHNDWNRLTGHRSAAEPGAKGG